MGPNRRKGVSKNLPCAWLSFLVMNEKIVKVWIINSNDGRWLSGPFETEKEAIEWLSDFHALELKKEKI